MNKETENALKILGITIIAVVVPFYSFASFVAADFNFTNWNILGRFMFAITSLIAICTVFIESDKK